MRLGDIVWVQLDPTVGHEQRGRRPVLIISERPTRSMVIVVPLTSTPPSLSTHYRMGGDRVSTALCEQVRSIDRGRIDGRYGQASSDDINAVRDIVGALIGI
jgi:mRNA interferase MazF